MILLQPRECKPATSVKINFPKFWTRGIFLNAHDRVLRELQNTIVFLVTFLKIDFTKNAFKATSKILRPLTGIICYVVSFHYTYSWYLDRSNRLKRIWGFGLGIFWNFQYSSFSLKNVCMCIWLYVTFLEPYKPIKTILILLF